MEIRINVNSKRAPPAEFADTYSTVNRSTLLITYHRKTLTLCQNMYHRVIHGTVMTKNERGSVARVPTINEDF